MTDISETHELPLFNVEHALNIYATSYCIIPAKWIYDKEALAPQMSNIEKCHIYMIGFVPVIEFIAKQNLNKLSLIYSILGEEYILESDIPDKIKIINQDGKLFYYLTGEKGERIRLDEQEILKTSYRTLNAINFEVKYIGMAYGNNGSRNAIDRLLKHETFQKIAIIGAPDGYELTLLLLEIHPETHLITISNPLAKNKDETLSRIQSGFDKLFQTTKKERIALYEASLIRYFSPSYNKEFKDSFPSTNLKILQDCYAKDFSAVIAEINLPSLPFKLFSESVVASYNHVAKHDLHKDKAREIFFGISQIAKSLNQG